MCLQPEGENAIVRVIDNGVGIPAESLDHVFELFSQVREHQQHSGGGLGIGLALVRSIVELHGGTVTVSSAGLGQGSTFSVRLPLRLESPQLLIPQCPAERALIRKRIVVVDDNADAAESLAMVLEHSGHEVFTAFDGARAVEQIHSRQPDVVFLDLGMPGMDGFEVARRIRAIFSAKSVLLVALTGWGQNIDRERTRDAGFDRHLIKPVSAGVLTDLLSK